MLYFYWDKPLVLMHDHVNKLTNGEDQRNVNVGHNEIYRPIKDKLLVKEDKLSPI